MPDPSPNSATISVPVLRDFQPVYEFASNPVNLPGWAPGLCNNIRPDGAEWVIDTPDGEVRVTFAGKNAFGVLDHWVHPAPGVEIYVPMRVVAAPHGSEVLFTVFRLPGMSDEEFSADQKMVLADLRRLKNLLEAPGAG